MLGPDKLRQISTFLLERCQSAQAEVWIEIFNEGLTRFANNVIHQNVSESNASISLRVTLDGRTGSATTNRLDGEALGDLPQPGGPGLPGTGPTPSRARRSRLRRAHRGLHPRAARRACAPRLPAGGG